MLLKSARAGMRLRELDRLAEKMIREHGGIPTFIGYNGFPSSICASVNEVVVHGIPTDCVLKEGDILSIDIGTTFERYVSDSAVSIAIGNVSRSRAASDAGHARVPHARDRADADRQPPLRHRQRRSAARRVATATASCGPSSGTASGSTCTRSRRFPTTANPGKGIVLKPGLCLAIEPMITEGVHEVQTLADGWTVVTADGKLAAHFEHTIALTEEGPRILTLRDYVRTSRRGKLPAQGRACRVILSLAKPGTAYRY